MRSVVVAASRVLILRSDAKHRVAKDALPAQALTHGAGARRQRRSNAPGAA